MKKWILVSALMLAMMAGVGCGQKVALVTPHPNQVSQLDGVVYDALVTTHAAIEQAKTELTAGTLPISAKSLLNQLVTIYNTTDAAWLAYRDTVIAAGTAGSAACAAGCTQYDKLQADYTQLGQSLQSFKMLTTGGSHGQQ